MDKMWQKMRMRNGATYGIIKSYRCNLIHERKFYTYERYSRKNPL